MYETQVELEYCVFFLQGGNIPDRAQDEFTLKGDMSDVRQQA